MKITHIISSKNRPAQLDLLLRSFEKFCSKDDFKIVYIIWKADNYFYRQGYEKIFERGYGFFINYIEETLLYKNYILSCLRDNKDTQYVLFNSDDNVFINKVSDLPEKLQDNEVCFSLRLGKGMNYCLPAKLQMIEPKFNESENYLKWDWTKGDRRVCYYYPSAYDSNIYRKSWLIEILKNKEFKNPYEIENILNTNRDNNRHFMMSFKKSKLISIMANTTGQNNNPLMKGKGQSVEELNQKWLDGWQLKTDKLYGINTRQAHIYFNFEFEEI